MTRRRKQFKTAQYYGEKEKGFRSVCVRVCARARKHKINLQMETDKKTNNTNSKNVLKMLSLHRNNNRNPFFNKNKKRKIYPHNQP